MLSSLTDFLQTGQSLSPSAVAAVVAALIDEAVAPEAKADFLTAFARKGETPEEIAAFAQELRLKAIAPPVDEATRALGIVDVCGTGGDGLRTFNISTTVALLVAAAGIPVAKHGNRAITSQCGSADVLEALGIPIDLSPEAAARSLRDHQFAFLFAPQYHPAFRHIAPARKLCAARGQRTIFNFLGPLLNPARPTAQLIGVPRRELCAPLARVLQSLGVRRGMVVCGTVTEAARAPAGPTTDAVRYLDELSTLGENLVAEYAAGGPVATSILQFPGAPESSAGLADLVGGDQQGNAALIERLLAGQDRGARQAAVLFNAAAALQVAGRARSWQEGLELGNELIDSGRAQAKLVELRRR